ncbi:hypothetical protein AB205_0110540 [Aquarana catesbeiana]|uniref:Uncharacterized protein n=1 Tax=Aquarana catesbeiana TaxID=8400 RepID=A0A2G9S3U2_AQUCT|nr:hypothetical protein AB205_0110540 [Aquarana catesbeiana]
MGRLRVESMAIRGNGFYIIPYIIHTSSTLSDIIFCSRNLFLSQMEHLKPRSPHREAQKKDALAKPLQWSKGGYPRLGPNRGEKHPECSMVKSTRQEQTLTSDQVQEESECGQLTQDVSLEPWDLSPGPSTDIVIVDIKSPDTSLSESQSEPEEE